MDAKKVANILAVVLILVYAVWSFTAKPTEIHTNDTKKTVVETVALIEEKDNHTGIDRTQEGMHKAISSIASKNGWKVTKFKSNTLIAEKNENENSVAVTITFNNSSFSLSPKNSELENILNDHLK